MGVPFTLYLKDLVSSKDRPYFGDNGVGNAAGKVVNFLKTYLGPTIAKSKKFSSVEVWWGPDTWAPQLLETDVIVYVVANVGYSRIWNGGGTVEKARANTSVLGMTDLNMKICEVYFDRMFQGSPKELAGAAYHEAAHILSNKDDSMHKGQDAFLSDAPDYNGSPSDKNATFFKTHLGRKINMRTDL